MTKTLKTMTAAEKADHLVEMFGFEMARNMVRGIDDEKLKDEMAIREYVRQREDHGYSAEERMEMKAAFGDQVVVDAFTGRRIDLNTGELLD